MRVITDKFKSPRYTASQRCETSLPPNNTQRPPGLGSS